MRHYFLFFAQLLIIAKQKFTLQATLTNMHLISLFKPRVHLDEHYRLRLSTPQMVLLCIDSREKVKAAQLFSCFLFPPAFNIFSVTHSKQTDLAK